MDATSEIRNAIIRARRGRKKSAEKILRHVLTEQPDNERAWWLLAGVVNDTIEIRSCLEKVISLNPQNEKARAQLIEIGSDRSKKRLTKTNSVIFVFIAMIILAFVLSLGIQNHDGEMDNDYSLAENLTHTPMPLASKVTTNHKCTSTLTATITKTIAPTTILTPTLPTEQLIRGISGQPMIISLDCESNSAVIFARYYGVEIDELSFFLNLPVSDNPHKGFVGDVHNEWGNIPPAGYGVYPAPVVTQLNKYGVIAKDVYGYTLEELEKQLANNNPVIIWVIGRVERGKASEYISSDGQASLVARYQHTVIVIGYDQERYTILDGDRIYTRTKEELLGSWMVLGNMAIIKSD